MIQTCRAVAPSQIHCAEAARKVSDWVTAFCPTVRLLTFTDTGGIVAPK